MYSNRTSTYLNLTHENNGDNINYSLYTKPLESIQISLIHFQMNNLIPNITIKNNQLDIIINNQLYEFTVPEGFYTIVELRDYLNALLKIHRIVVTYKNYKIRFVSTQSITIMATSTIKRALGLTKKKDQTSGTKPAYTLICPHSIDLTQHGITLKIKEFNVDWIESSLNPDKTFTKIPINCMYGQVIYYDPAVLQTSILKKHNIKTMTVILEDDFDNVINNSSFDLTFKIDYVYLPDNKKIDQVLVDEKDGVFPAGFQRYDGKTNIIIEDGAFSI